MSAMFDKLKALGYRRHVESDHYTPETLANLSSIIERPVPEEFIRFLTKFPETGSFECDVQAFGLEQAPGIKNKSYDINIIYANCSIIHLDLLNIYENIPKEFKNYLIISHDLFANSFAIDLNPGEFGKVKYKSTEEDWDGRLYLVANDFESFILGLQSSD